MSIIPYDNRKVSISIKQRLSDKFVLVIFFDNICNRSYTIDCYFIDIITIQLLKFVGKLLKHVSIIQNIQIKC